MDKRRERWWRGVFKFKGLYNWLASLLLLWLLPPQGDQRYFQLFLALAFIFGFGYWWAGNNLQQNLSVIRMGVMGQGAVFVLGVIHNWGQPLIFSTLLQWGAAFVDGIFVLLFTWFLYEYNVGKAKA